MTTATTATSILGGWGRPPDLVAWIATGAAVALLVLAIAPQSLQRAVGLDVERATDDPGHRRRLLMLAAFAAAFLSLGYVAFYLRGGPRIIDAASYFLQGRALAHGKLAWHVEEPTASFRGRFLFFRDPDQLAGIFPPGYPLLLAAGFLVGAPMVVGPLLAAALVFTTYSLTRELCRGDGQLRVSSVSIALLAVALSVTSAALRYHTADTMAHGAAALGIALALSCALRGRRTQELRWFVFAGLLVGWVAATRMASALPIGVAVVVVLATSARTRAIVPTFLALLPGLALLFLAQRAATGHWFTSVQRAYYAASDGPPGCFRYGFGAGVGCLYEHGDFVKAHLGHGYGLMAALGTTGRRLRIHLLDIANFEPLALLVLVPIVCLGRRAIGRRAPIVLATGLVLAQVLAYAPFYFDGNYPGGGARLLADVLPVEHALMAVGVACLLQRVSVVRRGLVVVAVALAGFGVHAVFDHLELAKRDGGRPAYEADVAHEAAIAHGLVFFDSDAGFDLAYDPKAEASHEILAARQRNDDHDRLLYEHLGRPPTYAYRFAAEGSTLSVWVPTAGTNDDFWRFEAEADWPPLSQSGGWADPVWASGTCASGERALTVRPVPEAGTATVSIELPAPREGRWLVTPRVLRRGGKGKGKLHLVGSDGAPVDWEFGDAEGHDACSDLTPQEVALGPRAGRLILTATGGPVTLDRTNLRIVRGDKGTR